jgi:dihydroorotase
MAQRARLFQRKADAANLLISGARLFDQASGLEGRQLDVRIADGVIAEIGEGLPAAGMETVAADGLTMTPGLIDPHVHLRTPGDEDEEDIASGTRAAAAGGFVAILAMPNTRPVVDTATLLDGLIELAEREAAVPTGFMAAISRGQEGRELTDMVELAEHGAAAFSDDGRPVERAGMLRRALQYSSLTGLRLALHEEDLSLTAGAQMHEGAVSAELGLHGYPSIGESVMIARDLQIARYESAPLHLCHISAAESVAEIRRAKELGVEVTAEVSPHHLCLTDELVAELDPAVSKMNPPLRSAADRAALIEALSDGTLDCIAADHAPHRNEEKDAPFEAAPNGVIGLETAFAAVYTELVAPGLVPLSTVVDRMSAGPARAFGLATPLLRPGEQANLALWSLGETWTVAPPYASRSRNCAFAGRTLQGRCTLTVAGGSVAHRLVEVAR